MFRIVSLIWSDILFGWSSETDSEVNRKFLVVTVIFYGVYGDGSMKGVIICGVYLLSRSY